MNDQATSLRERVMGKKTIARTIAVISGKGGVGKSNIVLNMAIELQKLGKKTLILDLDIGMGNIDVLLGKVAKYSIVDFFSYEQPFSDMIEIGPKGLHFIAGASSLNELFELDDFKLEAFLAQFETLCNLYDYIFFDMGAGITKSSLSFILAADECLLIMTPEPTSITDGYSMMKQLFIHQPETKITVLINRSNGRQEGEKVMDKMNQVVERFLSRSFIPLGVLSYDPIVNSAVIRQTPFVLLKPNATISKQLRFLAHSFHSGAESQLGNTSPFLSKLKTLFRQRKDS